MAGTEGFKIHELDPLQLPLQAGDRVEVILPRPGHPGKMKNYTAPALTPNLVEATETRVGIFRFATVEESEGLAEGDAVVTPAGLVPMIEDILINRITVSGPNISRDLTDGVLTISGTA